MIVRKSKSDLPEYLMVTRAIKRVGRKRKEGEDEGRKV